MGVALLGTALCYLMLAAIRWISDMPSVPLALVLSGMVFGATLIDIWLKPARPGASRRQALLAVSEQALFRRGAWTLAAMFFGGVGFLGAAFLALEVFGPQVNRDLLFLLTMAGGGVGVGGVTLAGKRRGVWELRPEGVDSSVGSDTE